MSTPTPYYSAPNIAVYCGDCLDVLPTLAPESVDATVTDPPYGLGFMGKDWDHGVPGVAFWQAIARVMKPGAHLLAFGGSRTYHRVACAIEDAGFEIRDQIQWIYGQGFPKSKNLDGDWKGWGTALKPAHEPIVLARKPPIGTVAENVLTHGTGAINVDACRIDAQGETVDRGDFDGAVTPSHQGYVRTGRSMMTHKPAERSGPANSLGRWPANVIHDGSDEVLAAFPQAKGQQGPISSTAPSDRTKNVYGAMRRDGEPSANSDNRGDVGFKMRPGMRRLDEGSAARFFYCPKASREDRNEGCDGMERKPLHWSSGDQNPGSFQAEGTDKASANNHPTVKPTELMRYLCRLVTPPGGLILDPFLGSGSTGKAAILEGFRFVGIEREADYAEIAKARLSHEFKKHPLF